MEKKHKEQLVPQLMERFGYKNVMQVPKMKKIVINIGCGEMSREAKLVDVLSENLSQIAGQKPIVTRSRKAISNFKLRQGMIIGLKVTLRRQRMYEFLDRLLSVAIPRIRDFRGASTRSFDGRGNYTLGFKDQLSFPEIDFTKVDKARGMNVTIVTTAHTDEEALNLLTLLGMPFVRD